MMLCDGNIDDYQRLKDGTVGVYLTKLDDYMKRYEANKKAARKK